MKEGKKTRKHYESTVSIFNLGPLLDSWCYFPLFFFSKDYSPLIFRVFLVRLSFLHLGRFHTRIRHLKNAKIVLAPCHDLWLWHWHDGNNAQLALQHWLKARLRWLNRIASEFMFSALQRWFLRTWHWVCLILDPQKLNSNTVLLH